MTQWVLTAGFCGPGADMAFSDIMVRRGRLRHGERLNGSALRYCWQRAYGRRFLRCEGGRDTAEGFRIHSAGHAGVDLRREGLPLGYGGGGDRCYPIPFAEGLFCYEYWRTLSGPMYYRADTPGDKLFRAMLLPLAGGEALDVTASANDRGTLLMDIPAGEYHLFLMSSRRLFDGTHAAHSYSEPRNYINLLHRQATEAFVAVTHDRYAALLADEFGRGVRIRGHHHDRTILLIARNESPFRPPDQRKTNDN